MPAPTMDTAADLGAPADLQGISGGPQGGSPSGSASTPSDAVRGAIDQVNAAQRKLGEVRQTVQTLGTQFPSAGKSLSQISEGVDQLQKLLAGYMADVVKSTRNATEPTASLSGLLR